MSKGNGAPVQAAKRSRRELLAGAAGALGVIAVETVTKVDPASAANGDPVILGAGNDETLPTIVVNSQQGTFAFEGISTTGPGGTGLIGTGSGTGVIGTGSGTGVIGNGSGTGVIGNGSGTGVIGNGSGQNSTGVSGASNAASGGAGVAGTANGLGGVGVIGQSSGVGGTGVQAIGGDTGVDAAGGTYGLKVRGTLNGISVVAQDQYAISVVSHGDPTFPTISAQNQGEGMGLLAWAFGDADGALGQTGSSNASGLHGRNSSPGNGVFGESGFGNGVFGESQGDGNGVFGQTSSGIASGVYGENTTTGYGVAGRANDGTGVLAESANGIALMVNGKLQLSRAGLAVVPANKIFLQITGLSGLDPATSFVIATAQGNSKVWVRSVSVDSASALTIYLNAKAGANVPVAWFILN